MTTDTGHAADQCDHSWCVAHRACSCPYAQIHPHLAAGCRYASTTTRSTPPNGVTESAATPE